MAAQQSESDLTLERAAAQALEGSPLTRGAAARAEMASAAVDEARASRLPNLRFSERYTHSNNPVFVFGSLLEQSRFGPGNFAVDSLNRPGSLSNFRGAVELGLPVFDRFETTHRIKEAQIGTRQAQSQEEWIRQGLRFRVIEAYFGVILAQATRQVADEAVRTAEAQEKRIADLLEQGQVVDSDLLAIQVELASLRRDAAAAGGEMDTAWAELDTLLGQDIDSRFHLTTVLGQRLFPPLDRTAVLAEAMGNRPDRAVLVEQISLRRDRLRRAKNQILPDLALFAEFGHSSPDFLDGSADFAVGARLSIDILDFGRTPRIRQAQSALEEAEWKLRERENGIRIECIRALNDFASATEGVAALEKAGERAREALRIVSNRHEAGLTDITELLRAQTAVVRADRDVLMGSFGVYVGYARVLLAAGMLRDVAAFR